MYVKLRYENKFQMVKISLEEAYNWLNLDISKNFKKWNIRRNDSKHIFRKSNIEDFVIDIIDLFPDNSQEIERNNKEGYIAIQQWLESFLKLKEVEMFMTIEMKGMAIKEYARLNNIKPNTVTQKSKRMKNKIKINYEKCHI